MNKFQRAFTLILLLLALASACGKSAPPALPAEEVLSRAIERMKSLHSFHFVIDRDGAPAFLNSQRTLAFARAEGDFNAPDEAQATVRVIAPGLVGEVQMVALGDSYWETEPISGQWQKLPNGAGFNPATLFEPQSGFQEMLRQDLSALQYEGIEELQDLPGQPLYLLSGQLDGKRLAELSYGLIGPQPVSVRLWINPHTFELVRVQIDEPLPAGEIDVSGETATRWQVDFWDFDQVEPISAPPGG